MSNNTNKILDKDIASFFNVSEATLSNHKNSDNVKLSNRYKALKEFYINNVNSELDEVQRVAHKLGECIELVNGLTQVIDSNK